MIRSIACHKGGKAASKTSSRRDKTLLRRFAHCRSAAVLPMAGFIIPMVSAVTMFSIEVAKHQSSAAAVRQAADSALLMGARSMSEDMLNDRNFNENESRRKAQALAKSAFKNMSQNLDLASGIETLETDFYIDEDSVEGELSFDGKRDSLFKLFDSSLFKIGVDATATVPIRQRIDIHFVIDNSPSMNVGASRDDQEIMIRESGCAFACHRGSSKSHPDYLRDRGARMRIDVVAEAVSAALSKFEEIPAQQAEIFIGLHTFSNTAATATPLTTDFDDLAKDLASLDTVNELGQGGTNFHVAFDQISDDIEAADRLPNAVIPAKRYIIVMTDGIGDPVQWTHPTQHYWTYDPNFRTFAPRFWIAQGLDPNACSKFKGLNNTEVVVMELEYLPAGRSGNHQSAVDIFVDRVLRPSVGTNTRSCASSSEHVYRADDESEIRDNIDEMISDVIAKLGLRLTT